MLANMGQYLCTYLDTVPRLPHPLLTAPVLDFLLQKRNKDISSIISRVNKSLLSFTELFGSNLLNLVNEKTRADKTEGRTSAKAEGLCY